MRPGAWVGRRQADRMTPAGRRGKPPSRIHDRSRRTLSPRALVDSVTMETVLFVGGNADKQEGSVPSGALQVQVTMIDGSPKSLPVFGDPDGLSGRAVGTWVTYTKIRGLKADSKGRATYWATHVVGKGPTDEAHLITPELRADIQVEILLLGPDLSREILAQMLSDAGYTLPNDA